MARLVVEVSSYFSLFVVLCIGWNVAENEAEFSVMNNEWLGHVSRCKICFMICLVPFYSFNQHILSFDVVK